MNVKPLLRGHFHQEAFFIAVGACAMLIAKAEDTIPTVATIVYSLSLMFLLGVSSLYHRITWQPEPRKFMKRLDHCAIYILIAGTFTPICLLALGENSGKNLLITIWVVAFFGVMQSLFYVNAPKWLSAILYIIAGYMILPFVGELKTSIGVGNLVLLVCGGLSYTIGAVSYATKKPNFWPKIFGYHEVFHIWVVIGALFHFILVYNLL